MERAARSSRILKKLKYRPPPRLARRGHSLFRLGVKLTKKEIFSQHDLANPLLHQYLEQIDADLAEAVRQGGCLGCLVGKLHSAKYKRKPRTGTKKIQETVRHSFCCDQDGCRKRHTPPSVRFLGRRVYHAVVVVLVSAAHHGITPERMRVLREALGIDRRTLERWREWWLETFVQSSFWKVARARLMPVICEKSLPLSLVQAFGVDGPSSRGQLLELLSHAAILAGSGHSGRTTRRG